MIFLLVFFAGRYLLCPKWQDLHLTFIYLALKHRANFLSHIIPPQAPRPFAWCSHQFPPVPPFFFFWKVKNTLAVPSFENRATPKTIRAGGREMCAENSQGAETLGLRRFSFPLSGFQKQRNSRENQGRTSPQAKTAAATPTSLSLALSRTHTHISWQCAQTQTHSRAMVISCNHQWDTPSLVIQQCWFHIRGEMTLMCVCKCVCKCVEVGNTLFGPNPYFTAKSVTVVVDHC